MKKIFTLIAVAAMALSANAQTWNFESLQAQEYKTDPGIEGLTFHVTDQVDKDNKAGSLTVGGSNKTIAGTKYTKVLKWGGKTWDDGNKSLSFNVTGACKITLHAVSANSTDTRHIIIAKGSATNNVEADNVLAVLDAVPGTAAAYAYEYEGDAAEIFICSSDGFNLYGIIVSAPQAYKNVTEKTFFPLTEVNVTAATAEGWLEGGKSRVDNKKSTINPNTGETQEGTVTPGIGVKNGGDKFLKVYVKGAKAITAYGASTSNTTRSINLKATPAAGGTAIETSVASEAAATVAATIATLDPNTKYVVELAGLEGEVAGDCVIFGLMFDINGSGISAVKAAKFNADAPAYNLAGQKVDKDFKGLVIKNGVKVVNK